MEALETVFEVQYALDTFYFLVCGALVMWMAAGFAMLEAGLVRAKNTTEILTKNFSLFAIASIMYMVVGYQFMYDGGFLLAGITGSGVEAGFEYEAEATFAPSADFFFQVVFVATAMSIVSGAVAERMKLWAFLAFAVIMTGFIYPIQGAWSWGGGFLDELGYADFAGSGIVHMAGAAAALAGVIVLGPRKGKYGKDGQINAIPGANLPLATLGTFILWMGWFGFNGGSVLATAASDTANEVAVVFMNTNLAASGGAMTALVLSRLLFKKADLTMILNGALAGLVSITAGPEWSTPFVATLIGGVGGILVVLSIVALDKLKIDDPVGAISVHGSAGIWGILAVTFGGASISAQLIGIGAIFGWVFLTSLIVWFILKAIMGIRVSEEQEYEGVDLSECGMEAYPEFTTSGK
ncbi:ammonium transporter [Natronospirillum operosum]|uniref:Ammonium transporter n=1 Tax=Natronospirillum operosum TaxID=2759953 RepID=A0A4Z0W3Q3_9GAMM|nr:ammonium transporter [Natronospirillum operosum]TGG91352.1 ammonium transporter [Natronospirillum operosum]